MVHLDLARFEPFSRLDRNDVALVARHTHALTIPADRWLVRPGRQLVSHIFLVRGKVRVLEAATADRARGGACSREAIVSSRGSRARRAIYPGTDGVATQTVAQVLLVDPRALGFLADGAPVLGDRGLPTESDPEWLDRFLGGGVMRQLSSVDWQQVLRDVRERRVEVGELVLRRGEQGDAFYIVQRGVAGVYDGERLLAELGPGEFFGEDALIRGGYRRADVRMLSDGVLGTMNRASFLRLLLQTTVRARARQAARYQGQRRRQRGVRRCPAHTPGGVTGTTPDAGTTC